MIITGKSVGVPPLKLKNGVVKRVLIGPNQGAKNYVMRLFTVEKGGATPYHTHPWEHEAFIVNGDCLIRSGKNETTVTAGDFAYIPPNEEHQFLNAGADVLEFICVVPISGESSG